MARGSASVRHVFIIETPAPPPTGQIVMVA